MKKRLRTAVMKLYADTSVFGGCMDTEFKVWSNRLMDAFKQGSMTVVLSDLTLKELSGAPPEVAELVKDIPDDHNWRFGAQGRFSMKKKPFDCVEMMRKIRDKLSKKYWNNEEAERRDLEAIRRKYGIGG